jgi:hypothetical protein
VRAANIPSAWRLRCACAATEHSRCVRCCECARARTPSSRLRPRAPARRR